MRRAQESSRSCKSPYVVSVAYSPMDYGSRKDLLGKKVYNNKSVK